MCGDFVQCLAPVMGREEGGGGSLGREGVPQQGRPSVKAPLFPLLFSNLPPVPLAGLEGWNGSLPPSLSLALCMASLAAVSFCFWHACLLPAYSCLLCLPHSVRHWKGKTSLWEVTCIGLLYGMPRWWWADLGRRHGSVTV